MIIVQLDARLLYTTHENYKGKVIGSQPEYKSIYVKSTAYHRTLAATVGVRGPKPKISEPGRHDTFWQHQSE